eukprot:jgi/Galph1/4442/GphlegSOOS_G3079.1
MVVELSDDVLTKIFGILDAKDVLSCSLVCRSWNRVTRANQIWAPLGDSYFSPTRLKHLQKCLEENASIIASNTCQEGVILGCNELAFLKTSLNKQVDYCSGYESSESSTDSGPYLVLCGTQACCCHARKELAKMIDQYLQVGECQLSKYALFKSLYEYFSYGAKYVGRLVKVLNTLEMTCRKNNLPAARTLMPGLDEHCINEMLGNVRLPPDVYCLYRLCGGQYISTIHSRFQGVLGGYLFYDVLVDWNFAQLNSFSISYWKNIPVLKVAKLILLVSLILRSSKIGLDLFWHNERGSRGLFIHLGTGEVIEFTQSHYIVAAKDTISYLEQYTRDFVQGYLMVDRDTRQILRFSLCPTYCGFSDRTTGNIRIQATCLFVPGVSRFGEEDEEDEFVFAYRIRISMLPSAPPNCIYRLEQRHWIVTDTSGHVENIRGPGVIGEYPIFQPGSVFDYASCAPLSGPFGKLRGSFTFRPLDMEAPSDRDPTFEAYVGEIHLNFFASYRFPMDVPDKYLRLQSQWYNEGRVSY